MSTFKNWTHATVAEHNNRVRRQPAVLTIAAGQHEVRMKKATVRLGSRMLERDIQEEIEQWLRTQVHRAWWDRKRMDVATTSRKGVPDFIGSFAGVPFGLEVKRPGEKPTTDQLGELAWMRKAGAATAVVFSRDEAVAFFLSLTKTV